MKKFVVAGVFSLLVTAGVAVAQQSQNQNSRSSIHEMMHQMMENQGSHDAGMGHMGGMMHGMNMMMSQMDQEQTTKMIEQCSAMMDSAQSEAGGAKESQKQ